MRRIVYFLIFLLLSSCMNSSKRNYPRFVAVDRIFDSLQNKYQLIQTPHLLIDGYDIYPNRSPDFKESLKEMEIGHMSFDSIEKVVKIITPLYKKKDNDTLRLMLVLNNQEISYEQYRSIPLKSISKKVTFQGTSLIYKVFDIKDVDVISKVWTGE